VSENDEKPPRCEFQFDPEVDSDLNSRVVFSEIAQPWRCPQVAEAKHNGEHLCLFHLPTSQKQPQDVQERFVECVSQSGPEVKRFVGAKFVGITLPNVVLGSNDNNPIDLRHTTFENDVNIVGSTVSQPLYLTGAEIDGELKASGATFSGSLWAQHTELNGGISCSGAYFKESVNFRNTTFYKKSKFNGCRFEEEASFYGCEFYTINDYSPEDSRLAKGIHQPVLISFTSSTFSEGANLNSCVFHGFLECKHVTSEGAFRLSKIEFLEKALSRQYVPEDIDYNEEDDKHSHKAAEITGNFSILKISPDKIAEPPCIVSLAGAKINSGTIAHCNSDRLYYDFSGGELGDVQLNEMDEGRDWEYLIFKETEISGLNFVNYQKPLRECNYDICEVYDPHDLFDDLDIRARKNTFLKARIGADSVRAYSASSEFHIHELDSHLTHLWENKERLQYIIYRLYSFTCRYGEKPSRVLAVFTPLLLLSYAGANMISTRPVVANSSELLLTIIPPIFSGLLVLASSRYIGD
jgi:hypothetical protein